MALYVFLQSLVKSPGIEGQIAVNTAKYAIYVLM